VDLVKEALRIEAVVLLIEEEVLKQEDLPFRKKSLLKQKSKNK
jgi:hypothetical protein